MNKKVQKGEYGYRSALRKGQIIKVVIGAAAILLQLAARMLTDNQAAKNILTVMAILSVLPNGQCGVSHACRMEMEDSVRGFPPGLWQLMRIRESCFMS